VRNLGDSDPAWTTFWHWIGNRLFADCNRQDAVIALCCDNLKIRIGWKMNLTMQGTVTTLDSQRLSVFQVMSTLGARFFAVIRIDCQQIMLDLYMNFVFLEARHIRRDFVVVWLLRCGR
jgi:hypothetical protein